MNGTLDPQLYQQIGDCLMRADVRTAMELIAAQEGLRELYQQYADIFERENYLTYDLPDGLNAILLCYQRYFRDVFYLKQPERKAENTLFSRLRALLHTDSTDENMLGGAVEAAFAEEGLHALAGKTNGCYGPYIWKTTVPVTYAVELPDGVCRYTVNILKDFTFRSWMDYLTFGTHGTGGWAGKDGSVNCVESVWDFESEKFKVSLLKHEAQHIRDMEKYPQMEPWELEYRAKLVELIYTEQNGLLAKFIGEAVSDRTEDSHAVAACRLAEEMTDYVNQSTADIQKKAAELFQKSNAEAEIKYRK